MLGRVGWLRVESTLGRPMYSVLWRGGYSVAGVYSVGPVSSSSAMLFLLAMAAFDCTRPMDMWSLS
jgi:hypothetical protein